MNIHMEEMHSARYVERVQGAHCLPKPSTILEPLRVHQPRRSSNPVLLGLLCRLHHVGMMEH